MASLVFLCGRPFMTLDGGKNYYPVDKIKSINVVVDCITFDFDYASVRVQDQQTIKDIVEILNANEVSDGNETQDR